MSDESPEMGILRIVEPVRSSVLLDDNREDFCRNIVARCGLENSYNAAHGLQLSPTHAKEMALLLLNNPDVCKRINQLERERVTYRNITKEAVVVGLKDIFDVSIADYFNEDFSGLRPSNEWSDAMRLAAKKVKFNKFGVEFEMTDKMAVAEKMISMLGFVKPEQKEMSDSGLSKFTDAELAAMAGVDTDYEEVKPSKKIKK